MPVLYEMLFACCPTLLEFVRQYPYLRIYKYRNREQPDFPRELLTLPKFRLWNITSTKLCAEFSQTQPLPEHMLLFEKLCEAFDSM